MITRPSVLLLTSYKLANDVANVRVFVVFYDPEGKRLILYR